ncbi:MAG TPA: DUF4190 domain-containing protein [Gemmataceae bacterium]|nr:DUF4190 domain-containing protein [Gemmataceae bacterium]
MSTPEEFQSEPPAERPPLPPKVQAPRHVDKDDEEDFRRTDDDAVATIIPYKNPKALLAYYFGVFGLIPCVGAILGPAALVLGILGLRYVRQHPTAHGTGHAIAGIVLGIIDLYNWVIILLAAIGFLAAAISR